MKLGTLLLRDAVISLGQLEAALRAQVLYGGKLGTNLVELGFLDLDALGAYLGRVTGTPVASRAQFEETSAATIGQFESNLAELYVAFPLGDDPGAPGGLAVALADPTDETSIDQLAAQCGRPIVPYIAPELRIYYYLEKHFGIARKARFVRTGTGQSEPGDNRRRTQPPHGMEMPPAVRFEPKKKAAKPARPAPPATFEPRVDTDACIHAMEAAESREQIADAIIEYAVGRFDAAVVFLLRDSNAFGWRVFTANSSVSADEIEQLSLPLGGASVLQAAHDSHGPYRGPALTAGRPVEAKLWEALHVSVDPAEMLVVPVMLRTRVVNLVYAHTESTAHVSDDHVDGITHIARHASEAYSRLIKRAKTASDNE